MKPYNLHPVDIPVFLYGLYAILKDIIKLMLIRALFH